MSPAGGSVIGFVAGVSALGAAIMGVIVWWRKDLEAPLLGWMAAAGCIAALAAMLVRNDWSDGLVLSILACLAVIDVKRRILPNELTYGLIVFGLALAAAEGDWPLAITGGVIGFGCFWGLRAIWLWRTGREALGLGDAKLMAGIGAYLGPAALPDIVFWGAIMGIAYGLGAMAINRSEAGEIPFGATLGAAVCIYLAAGPLLMAL